MSATQTPSEPVTAAMPRGLVDFWYANELGRVATRFPESSSGSKGGPIASLVSAVSILGKGRAFDYIAPDWYRWGRLAVLINAIRPRPIPVILFEVIDYGAVSRKGLKGTLVRAFVRFLLAPAMRRCVRLLHVMTLAEREKFIQLYGLRGDIVKVIPWPLLGWTKPSGTARDGQVATAYVFSSGRAACDWPTIFRAAQEQPWKLVVVCSRGDLPMVETLNKDVGARVLSEISKAEHDQLLAQATVCVIGLREERKSSGQVRLGAAIELGVPTVASDVAGLKGYLQPDINALAYPPGDSLTLRNQINRLLSDSGLRSSLKESAIASCGGYKKSDYFQLLESAVVNAPLR